MKFTTLYKVIIVSLFVSATATAWASQALQGNDDNTQKRVTVNPKVPVTTYGVDTLTLAERIALKTSVFDWVALIPNIGAEFDIKPVTWNRWTVGINVRGNWNTSHTYKPSMVYNIFDARLEGRQYWRARQIGERRLEKHKHFYDRVFSIRRSRVKHPLTTWYRGVFVSYMTYSIKLGTYGHQGQGIMAGVSYGFVRPLYAFPNGNSLDFEVGASAGALYTKNEKYTFDAESDCYPVVEIKDYHVVPHPVINDIHIGLVYRLGKHPVTSKYRYRRDADQYYNDRKDSITLAHSNQRLENRSYKENHDLIIREFWHVYDSIAAVNKQHAAQERLQQPKPERKPKKGSEKADEAKDESAKAAAKGEETPLTDTPQPSAPAEEPAGKEAADEQK